MIQDDRWNEETAISRHIGHLDLLLKNADSPSIMAKVQILSAHYVSTPRSLIDGKNGSVPVKGPDIVRGLSARKRAFYLCNH